MFGETQQILRRRANPSERDKLQEERVSCPFIGDTDVDISHRWSPPISWTIIWEDTYSNLIGWYIPEELRRWGYVFWDVTRIDSAARQVLKDQFAEAWEDNDPRDNVM
jgi:hypothetical protein